MTSKPNVAFITPTFSNFMSMALQRGAAATASDVNLLFTMVPPHQMIGSSLSALKLFGKDLIAMGLHGSVVHTAGIGFLASRSDLSAFLNLLSDQPMTLIGEAVDDYPTLMIDNQQAMYNFSLETLKRTGAKKLMFVKGPEKNEEAQARRAGFHMAAKEMSIPSSDIYELQGCFASNISRKAFQEFLGYELDLPELIVCSNDIAAKEVMEELQKINVDIPGQVKVTGYDDLEYARLMPISLSTVHQPAEKMGVESMRQMQRQLQGEDIHLQSFLPTINKFRESTGHLDDVDEDEMANAWNLTRLRDLAIYRLDLARSFNRAGSVVNIIAENTSLIGRCRIRQLWILTLEQSELKVTAACVNERFEAQYLGMPAEGILNRSPIKEYLSTGRWCITPMMDKDSYFGVMLVQTSEEDTDYVELLAMQISDLFSNLSIRKKAESLNHKLQQNERLAGLGVLVKGVAHEINTPVGNAVLAASCLHDSIMQIRQLSLEGKVLKKDFDGFLESALEDSKMIELSLARTARLVSLFKEVSAETGEKRGELSLDTIVQDVLNSLRPKCESNHVCLKSSLQPVRIISVTSGWVQVLTHLIKNALTYAFKGVEKPTITVSLFSEDGYCVLEVRDNGIGISEELREKVFNPFFTTDRAAGRTGLGLHIVYNLVEHQLGGEISLVNDGGCRFRIEVPIQSFQAESE